MIVITDSGSTKTVWCFVENGKITESITSDGINPFFESKESIIAKCNEVFAKVGFIEKIEALYFYGAGCKGDNCNIIKDALLYSIGKEIVVEVNSDMLGAARAVLGRECGIACILGTGSNSCLYNGDDIVYSIPPLGYILGDEGSGAYIGKVFIGSLLKNQFGEEFKTNFLSECNLTTEDIIERVYRQPFPNRFLATLSPIILKHTSDERVFSLVLNCFKDFFKRNVMQYDYKNSKVAFVGSVAFHYKDILTEAAKEYGISINKIEASPIIGLVEYHSL